MPVIINDLEVVVDSEQPQAPEAAERRAAEPAVRPDDINAIVERQLRLLTRVLAH